MEQAQAPSQQGRLTLTIKEAEHALGLSESLVRRLIQEGQIEVLRIGRRVLVKRASLEAFVAGASRVEWAEETDGAPLGIARLPRTADQKQSASPARARR